MSKPHRTGTVLRDNWEIEEDDFGDPMIFHWHAGEAVPAYIIGGAPQHRFAKCSECADYLEFVETLAPPHYAVA